MLPNQRYLKHPLKLLFQPILNRNYKSNSQSLSLQSTLNAIRQKQNNPRTSKPIEPLQSVEYNKQQAKVAPAGRLRRDEEISARFITFIDENGQVHDHCRLMNVLDEVDRSRYFLIEVDPAAQPNPVCRLFDKKTLFEKEKKSKKKKSLAVPESILKEISFGWNVSNHDMEHKLNKAIQFLDKGNKVKVDIVHKKGQNIADEKMRSQLICKVTELLNSYKMTKKPIFNGHNCTIQFEGK
ncbi:uncharacterized protein BX663DRAFT_504852 [Cokeromyces recurvatus]|uniref:uncharacterized protein n=1 Tax=Cokeromyces recurvatus TaxID=90255 RepID=UPI00221F0620|nr:uncharacterized protein BX663DRAFT_504852 [Cokeromyces recurvatus]KAI7904375.1 hypothetical protein BX663DRAFT_504852 [Cokeromyces recurvatus]